MPHRPCPKQFRKAKSLKLCTVSEPEPDLLANEQMTTASAWTKPVFDEVATAEEIRDLGKTMLVQLSQNVSDEQAAEWLEEWPPLVHGDHEVKKSAEQRNNSEVNGASGSKASDGSAKMNDGQKENRNAKSGGLKRHKNHGSKAKFTNNRQHQNYCEETYKTEETKCPSENLSSNPKKTGRKPLHILADFIENLHLDDKPKQVQEETKEIGLNKLSKKKGGQVMKKVHDHTQDTSQKCVAPSGYKKKHRRSDATGQNEGKRTSFYHRNKRPFDEEPHAENVELSEAYKERDLHSDTNRKHNRNGRRRSKKEKVVREKEPDPVDAEPHAEKGELSEAYKERDLHNVRNTKHNRNGRRPSKKEKVVRENKPDEEPHAKKGELSEAYKERDLHNVTNTKHNRNGRRPSKKKVVREVAEMPVDKNMHAFS